VQLTVDGQTTRLQPGVPGGVRLSWPSLDASTPVRLAATTAAHTETPALRFDGPWALFRLFDAARAEGGTPERMALSFALGEHRVVFELRSYSVRNPLRLPELAQFRCPG
jgi:type VI secretion system protein ImpL